MSEKIVWYIFFAGEIYTSESTGSDETGDGTSDKPFKSVLQVNLLVLISVRSHWRECTLKTLRHSFAAQIL